MRRVSADHDHGRPQDKVTRGRPRLGYRSANSAAPPESQNVNPSAKPPLAGSTSLSSRLPFLRLWPLAILLLAAIGVVAMGWHRALTLETLVRHRIAMMDFIAGHTLAAIAAFVALYVAVVALSLPGASVLTLAGGVLFGGIIGGSATFVGATLGAAIVFLIAKSAFGEYLLRRAGVKLATFAEGFREDAFSYLLFLRLVPLFPFWLVNLVPALLGVRIRTYLAATMIGILPGTFAFAFIGDGLGSVVAAQENRYRACLAAGRADCRVDFDVSTALTPELFAAFVALGVVALVPVAVKRWRAHKSRI
jgi:uncharacterized membrane protein YdjX (TVP38/TMEM64 family)